MCSSTRPYRGAFIALVALVVPAAAHAQHDMAGMAMSVPASMSAPLDVADAREGSGTSWLPDETPSRALMTHKGAWMLMAHGRAFAQFIDVTGPRGDRQAGSINWLMGMARRDVFGGDLTLRAMVSLEPLTVGRCGYPDVVQSGESCKGESLHDRQHPHDLFMELAATIRRAVSTDIAVELYAAVAGEPALGPVAFPHRPSAWPNPIAPVSHHWLDATHVSFGVVTGGVYGRRWKAETSAFNAQEPDDERYDLEVARLDSWSGRAWWIPSARWAVQVSSGRLRNAEQRPEGGSATVVRTTASMTHHRRRTDDRWWTTTVAWGRNQESEHATSAWLAETTFDATRNSTLFVRGEMVEKTAHDLALPLADTDSAFSLSKVQAGVARTLARGHGIEASVGATAGIAVVPRDLRSAYGRRTPGEFSVFFLVQPRASVAGAEHHP